MQLTALIIAACLAVDPVAPTSAHVVTVVSIHDADTITASVDLGWGVTLAPRAWRANLFDAYEIDRTRKTVGTITDAELVKGREARDDLQQLLAQPGTTLWFEDPGSAGGQTYDRTISTWWVKTSDGKWVWLAGWMRDRGHLRVPLGAK